MIIELPLTRPAVEEDVPLVEDYDDDEDYDDYDD